MKRELRSGYTTGTCAAAAAKGAALMLVGQAPLSEVTIDLPAGISATFLLNGQSFSANEASCFVAKDAGDDPDITNGAEVWATVAEHHQSSERELLIEGGKGIGKVTKPGLAIQPGEWAINPVPRLMIEQAVGSVLTEFKIQSSKFKIVISIPDGDERAKKTLNARLGIIGGLSILGTTGIVRPISTKAWTDTIDAALDVAKACGCKTVILSTGRSSEIAAQKNYTIHPSPFTLSDEAYIMMGDHVAYALLSCMKRGFSRPIIACQFAKLLKIACGHENTHAAASELDLAVLLEWAETAHIPPEYLAIISHANTAREIAVATDFNKELMKLVADRATQAAAKHAPGILLQPLLCRYDGNIV